MDFLGPLLLGLFLVLGVPILAIAAFVRTSALRAELAGLRARLTTLEAELAANRIAAPSGAEPAAPEPAATEQPAAMPEAAATPEPALPEPVWSDAVPSSEDLSAAPAAPAAAPARRGFEERLTSRWLVWLGGVMLALGAAFLVKFSIDQGLLGPAVRIALGLSLGMGLIGLAEGAARSERRAAVPGIKPSLVPPALAAAGTCAIFASLHAAHALYLLVPAAAAFAGLAATAAAAVLLSLRHGPFMAALGILGGLAVPLLVATGEPTALGLFVYLAVLIAAALGVLRHKCWWWLAWLALGGGIAWTALWLVTFWQPGDAPVVAAFLLVLSGLFWRGLRLTPQSDGTGTVRPILMAGGVAVALAMIWVVLADDYGTVALLALAALHVACMAAGRRDSAYDGLALVSAAATVAVVLAWQPVSADVVQRLIETGKLATDTALRESVINRAVGRYLLVAAGFGALSGLGGFAALWGAVRPWRWAALSVATPLVLLTVAYWRVEPPPFDPFWPAAALALASLALAAAVQAARYRAHPGLEPVLGIYAVGVLAATALSAAMALHQAWLTVALALHLPALAWVDRRMGVRFLRPAALVVAAVVLVRLAFNPMVLSYPVTATPLVNWLLYGYGLPMLAFGLAAHWFRKVADDGLVVVLEAGAIAFGTLLIGLQIRHLMHGGELGWPGYDLPERGTQAAAWLAIAYGLLRGHARSGRPVQLWAACALATLAAAQGVIIDILADNPAWSAWPVPVGDWPVLNLLGLVYGVPTVFFLLISRAAGRQGMAVAAWAGAALSLAFAFVWLSLEIRRAFHGTILAAGAISDAEWYAYSAGWLIFAGLVLAAGMIRREPILRYAGLALILVAVAKVFMFDMSALTGLYRALSFLGLGAALVAIGFFYRKYVTAPSLPPAS